MRINKILLTGFMGILTVDYALAQTAAMDTLQSGTIGRYYDDKNDEPLDK